MPAHPALPRRRHQRLSSARHHRLSRFRPGFGLELPPRQTDPSQPPHDSSASSRAPSWPSTVHVKGLVSTWQSASEVFRSARSRLERTLPGRIWTHLGELGFIDSSLQFAALFTLSFIPFDAHVGCAGKPWRAGPNGWPGCSASLHCNSSSAGDFSPTSGTSRPRARSSSSQSPFGGGPCTAYWPGG